MSSPPASARVKHTTVIEASIADPPKDPSTAWAWRNHPTASRTARFLSGRLQRETGAKCSCRTERLKMEENVMERVRCTLPGSRTTSVGSLRIRRQS